MGSKYPSLKSSEVIRILIKFGFVLKSQKGSHAKYIKTVTGYPTKTVIVPMHYEISKWTLSKIILQAGLTINDFTSK